MYFKAKITSQLQLDIMRRLCLNLHKREKTAVCEKFKQKTLLHFFRWVLNILSFQDQTLPLSHDIPNQTCLTASYFAEKKLWGRFMLKEILNWLQIPLNCKVETTYLKVMFHVTVEQHFFTGFEHIDVDIWSCFRLLAFTGKTSWKIK